MSPRTVKSALGDGWRSARARIGGSAIVLTYHRITDLSSDPQRLAVGVEQFDQQMEMLSTSYNAMGAGDLLELIAHRRRIPDRSVVVTIDDGYSDALLNAKPILAMHSVPATVFVTSDYVGGDREFWWDELERTVLLAEGLPSRLDIDIGGARCSIEAIAPLEPGVEHDPGAHAWDITQPPATQRQRLYLRLCDLILPLSAVDRETALASLRAQLGVERSVRTSHEPLSAEQIRELGTGGIVEVGAHTRSHQMLSRRTADEQRDEILGGRRALEQATGREVRLFSYPYGAPDSHSESSVSVLREAGFLGAFTTRFGIALPWTDRFRAPRCPTENMSGAEFEKRLDRWFEMAR